MSEESLLPQQEEEPPFRLRSSSDLPHFHPHRCGCAWKPQQPQYGDFR